MWNAFKSEFSKWRGAALPGLSVIAAVTIARLSGILQAPEWAAFDLLLRSRPPEPIDERIVIVGINESDIQAIGRYPIPDRTIAGLLKTLQAHQPAVIGLDIFRDLPVEPGHAELTAVLSQSQNVIGIEQAIAAEAGGFRARAPVALPPEQVAFADAAKFDDGGNVRRVLLSGFDEVGEYRFSLALLLAEDYLRTKGLVLDNGLRDPSAMRFGQTEFTRFQPDSGAYVGADAQENQVLLNFRSGRQPFQMLSLSQIQAGQFQPEWIRNRIVLIGITAVSVKDVVNSAAVPTTTPGLITGVELHAHITSQLLSAVENGRPLLQGWAEPWEYLWIVGWGVVGIIVGRQVRSPWKLGLLLPLMSLGLIGACFGLLLMGWWVPLVPALIGLVLNGIGPTAVLFYRQEQDLRFRLKERQFILEHTFTTIHNGPLQTLGSMVRTAETTMDTAVLADLQLLNQELRSVYETVRRETLSQNDSLHLNRDLELDLNMPLHEIFYTIYCNTLEREREFPQFPAIKVKIIKLEPLDCHRLSLEHKRSLCRFLEEALCNVGKYAIGAKRLSVLCGQIGKQQFIRVIDDGCGVDTTAEAKSASGGYGTQQARNLAKQLGGSFRRYPNQPQGTVCELIWSVRHFWFW